MPDTPYTPPNLREQPAASDMPLPMDVNENLRDSPVTNIHVDAKTGQVIIDRPDGGIDVQPQATADGPNESSGFDVNLAVGMDDSELNRICSEILKGIEADEQARRDWVETGSKGMEYLGIRIEEPSAEVSPQGSIAKVHSTMLLEAVMRSWANSRAELLPVGGPVKVRDDKPVEPAPPNGMLGHNGGPPMDAAPPPQAGAPPAPQPPAAPPMPRADLAQAFETDFNHYLTVVDKEYYPDTSRMLFSRALLGCQFKKIYKCPIRRRPVSVWVKGTDLIVSNDASHLMGAGRVTERIMTRDAMVKRLQAVKHWRNVPLIQPNQTPTPTDQTVAMVEGVKAVPDIPADHRHTIYECYTDLAVGRLAKDENNKDPGFPLPYRVTIDKDSHVVLEIRRNWKEGDEDYKKRHRYVKFGFVPGLGFYDLGFIHILGGPQRAMTAIERQLIDAGMFASFPGGLIAQGPGSREATTEIRVGPGQFAKVQTAGLPIQQVVMPLPYKEPSQVLQQLLGGIGTDARRLAGVLEIPMAEGRIGDVPVGTILSYIESISKVPSAVHKDDHMAQQEEFELLRELFIEDPECLSKFARRPAHKWSTAEELEDKELVPAADPNVPSQVHRLMQATAITQASGLPQFQGIPDQRGVWNWVTRTLGIQDNSGITLPPQPVAPPAPDPKIVAQQLKNQGDQQKIAAEAQARAQEGKIRQGEIASESADRAADRASRERVQAMKNEGDMMKQQMQVYMHGITTAHDATQAHLDRGNTAGIAAADRTHEAFQAQADRAAQPEQAAA